MTGRAHVSTTVFGQDPIWGWGNAWRDNREFVGRLEYGAVYKLWNPQVQPKFGGNFQNGARTLFLCQRRWESPMSMLPDECIYYILNMCRWDWFNDTGDTMKVRRKQEKARIKQKALEEAQKEEDRMVVEAPVVASAAAVAVAKPMEEEVEGSSSSRGCCSKRGKSTGLDDEDRMEEDEEASIEDDNEEDVEIGSHDEDDEGEWRSVDEEEDDDAEDEDESSDEEWSEDEDQYHRANVQAFSYRDVDSDASDDEQEQDDGEEAAVRRAWLHRQFARVHVLRALASMEDSAVAHVQF
jgi:hypothetical protein